MSAVNDVSAGRAALVYFHNQALMYPQNYKMTFEQLCTKINAESPDCIRYIGASIPASRLNQDEIRAGMEQIADDGEGRLPKNYADFMNFIVKGSMDNISFVSAVVGGVKDTAVQLATGAVKVGDAAVGGVTNTLTILPVIVAASALLFVFVKAKTV